MPEFQKRNVKVAALSVDPYDSHRKWISDIEETQKCKVNYPIIPDENRSTAQLYGMLDQTNVEQSTGMPLTVRSVFIIDPKQTVRWMITYPASCGRNFDEILRCVDSLQLTDSKKVATPGNWKKGDPVIIAASLTDEQAKPLFKKWETQRPYLRLVKPEDIL